jgi:hypothetical protein
MIETLFADGKQHGGTIRQVKLRNRREVGDVFTLVDLRRLPTLFAAQVAIADRRERCLCCCDSNGNRDETAAPDQARVVYLASRSRSLSEILIEMINRPLTRPQFQRTARRRSFAICSLSWARIGAIRSCDGVTECLNLDCSRAVAV